MSTASRVLFIEADFIVSVSDVKQGRAEASAAGACTMAATPARYNASLVIKFSPVSECHLNVLRQGHSIASYLNLGLCSFYSVLESEYSNQHTLREVEYRAC